HGSLAVLVLAPLVLALDLDPGGKVADADRAFSLVDVLAAGPAGAHSLPFKILLPDLDLDFVRLGHHGHRRGGSVNSPLSLGLRHALDPMAAAFIAKSRIDIVSRDAEHDFLVASLFAGAERDVFDLEAMVAGVVTVHVVKVPREESG